MPLYRLTDGSDVFDSFSIADWSLSGDTVFGKDGEDDIHARGSFLLLKGGEGDDSILGVADHSVLRGGEGDDRLEVGNFRGAVDDRLFGGEGNDTLIATGQQHRLDGGEGDDLLISSNSALPPGFIGSAAGNVMVGDGGADTFSLHATNSYVVTEDSDGVLSDGDRVHGFMDVIADYQSGDTIDIGASEASAAGFVLVPPDPTAGSTYLTLGAGHYAALRGDLDSPTSFAVDGEGGHDLLILYQRAEAQFAEAHYGLGAVVLHGVTSLDGVTFA